MNSFSSKQTVSPGSILVPSFHLPTYVDLRDTQKQSVHRHRWGICHFPPPNNHYLYNIAALIKGNPLPSAIHVPASASDANRIRKQDLSPPFTFCSFQPLDITLSPIPLVCSIIWHSWFLPFQVLVTILLHSVIVLVSKSYRRSLLITLQTAT